MNASSQTPPRLFDPVRIAAADRRARRGGPARFLLDHANAEIVERLGFVSRRFPEALDLGAHDGALAKALTQGGQVDAVVRYGPQVRAEEDEKRDDEGEGRSDAVSGPLDRLPFAPARFDLVVSSLALHLVDDLPGVLVQARRCLKPDGLFLCVLPGAGTLAELRDVFAAAELETKGGAAMRVAPFIAVKDGGALLQRAGFALPVSDQEALRVRYDTLFALTDDLRAMGATNPLAEREPLTRGVLMRAAALYAEAADPDGRIGATFNLVSLSGWAPHDSQQKPLKPGSAKMRLADALGVAERGAD